MKSIPADDFSFFGGSGEMAERMRAHDWENSPLGAPSSWPESLRSVLGICLDSHFPIAVWWGSDLIQFYNDAFRPILGATKHPHAFIRAARETWPDVWPTVGPLIDQVMIEGQAVKGDDMPLLLERNGYPERCFFTFSYSPLRDSSGAIAGMFIVAVETTARVLLERRQAYQLQLSDRLRGLSVPTEMTRWACQLLGQHLTANRIGYAEVDEQANSLFVQHGWTDGTVPSFAGQKLPVDIFGMRIVAELRSGRTVCLGDIELDERAAGSVQAYAQLGVRAMLIVPLTREGRLIAVLAVGAVEPRRWTAEEIALAEDTAERTRSAVERAITEQALTNQLAMERDRLHALFDQAPGFMAVLRGPDHVFELVNKAFLRLVGNRPLLGKSVLEALPESVGQGLVEKMDQAFASGMPYSALEAPVLINQMPGGAPTQLYLDFVYQPIIEINGVVSGIFVEGYDVTQRKHASDALREADRRKDEFLAMLAHELRNPLAPISAASELMAHVKLDEAGLKKTGFVIARQVRHMTGLIDDLLDVSRVTRGLVTLRKSTQEMKGILTSAIEQARPAIESRRHHLAVHLPAEPVHVCGDQKRLVQVVANLLNNAAKYTPEGGHITLRMEAADDHVTLDVIDNGIGIAPELQPRVFELFTQAERSPDRSQGGLGLGLGLVKSLIGLHGGAVSCHSDGAGRGSRFSLSLPRLREPEELPDAPQHTNPLAQAAKPLRLMIVDDNADAASTLAMYLESAGYHVLVEEDSRAALDRACTEAPDACLLDIGMPELDGYELARRLRADARTRRSTLIAVTGYGQEQDRETAMSAGFDHHLIKPVDTARLGAILANLDRR